MNRESGIFLGFLAIGGGAAYISYLNNKVKKLESMIDVAVDDLASKTEVNISDNILETAIQRAVDKEVKYVAAKVTRDLNSEIRSQVKDVIDRSSVDIKTSTTKEIVRQVRNLDISDIEREVINQAKDAVAEKFDRKLDGLLDDFNENLQNVQKIYSSIAKSMSKD